MTSTRAKEAIELENYICEDVGEADRAQTAHVKDDETLSGNEKIDEAFTNT